MSHVLNLFHRPAAALVLCLALAQAGPASVTSENGIGPARVGASRPGHAWPYIGLYDQSSTKTENAVDRVRRVIAEVVGASYPELANTPIEVKSFFSPCDYFQSRFSISRYVTVRSMHYIMRVNPALEDRNCPEAALKAIVAHELAHSLSFKQHNRLAVLGLVKLADNSYTAQFERRTDLVAISRGYAEGLKEYRRWLYQNIPTQCLAAKYRDYFSPEEIDAITARLRTNPKMMDYWLKHVPRNLAEINRGPS